jgi:hypothetical protein
MGKGRDHDINNSFKKTFMITDTFGHYNEWMMSIRRLCQIMWSRKWHNLPPQTLMLGTNTMIFILFLWQIFAILLLKKRSQVPMVKRNFWKISQKVITFWGRKLSNC